jgi:hypothetical protein
LIIFRDPLKIYGGCYYLRQLSRLTDIALGPVQGELKQLVGAGLVTKKIVGAQTLYSANQESPVFGEIKSPDIKTVGMRDVLRTIGNENRPRIRVRFHCPFK